LSNVTKIFIVLQLALSIGLAVAVVMILGWQTPLQGTLKAEHDGRVAAAALVQKVSNDLAAAKASATLVLADKDKALATANATIQTLQTDLAAAKTRGETLEVQLAEANAGLGRQINLAEGLRQQLAAKDTELTGLRPKVADLTKMNAELVRANNDLSSQQDANLKAISALKEELAIVRQGAQKSAAMESGGQMNAAPVAAVQINGRVEGTNLVNGRTYLTLSLGTRDGVQVGMRFTIYRKDAYVADAVVQRVVPEQSVAVMGVSKQAPQAGDLVISGGGL